MSKYFLRKWAASETDGKVWLVSSYTESRHSLAHLGFIRFLYRSSLALRSQKPSDGDGRDLLSTLVCEYAHPFYIPRLAL